jgi:hypothetical protein
VISRKSPRDSWRVFACEQAYHTHNTHTAHSTHCITQHTLHHTRSTHLDERREHVQPVLGLWVSVQMQIAQRHRETQTAQESGKLGIAGGGGGLVTRSTRALHAARTHSPCRYRAVWRPNARRAASTRAMRTCPRRRPAGGEGIRAHILSLSHTGTHRHTQSLEYYTETQAHTLSLMMTLSAMSMCSSDDDCTLSL